MRVIDGFETVKIKGNGRITSLQWRGCKQTEYRPSVQQSRETIDPGFIGMTLCNARLSKAQG